MRQGSSSVSFVAQTILELAASRNSCLSLGRARIIGVSLYAHLKLLVWGGAVVPLCLLSSKAHPMVEEQGVLSIPKQP